VITGRVEQEADAATLGPQRRHPIRQQIAIERQWSRGTAQASQLRRPDALRPRFVAKPAAVVSPSNCAILPPMFAAKFIAVWLTSDDVPGFNFTAAHAAQVAAATGAAVRVCANGTEFAAALAAADVALTWRIPAGALAGAHRLRWIATPAAGRDYLNLAAVPGVRITYGHFHGEFMAETVLGMMLAEARGLTDAVRRQLAGELWPRQAVGARCRSLRGTHAVIVGYGNIGRWIARLGRPFGVRVTGLRRQTVHRLDALLPATDHLVLVLPAEDDSRHLLDARRLALLPAHAVVYNVGRGHCVAEAALAAALQDGRLRAAYLDVYQREPLPADSPLRRCPNAVLLPHTSAASPFYMDRFVTEFLADYRAAE